MVLRRFWNNQERTRQRDCWLHLALCVCVIVLLPATQAATSHAAGGPSAKQRSVPQLQTLPQPPISPSQPVPNPTPAASIALVQPLCQRLSIDQAMTETLMQSPRAASLRLQLGIAKSQLVRATKLPNPNIFMDNGYKAEFTYRYGWTIPIEPPWKLALRIIAAKKTIRLADLEIAKGLWALRSDVRKAYTEVLITQERYHTLSELAELYKGLLTAAEKRFKAGSVAKMDVYRADLAYTQATINRDQMQDQVCQAKQVLGVLVGRNYDSNIDVPRLPPFRLGATKTDYLPDFERCLPELPNLLVQACKNRLEIRIANQAIRTNGANLAVSIGNIIPNPVMGVGSSVVNGPALPPDADPSTTKNKFRGYFFQTFLELPIFDFQQGDISLYRATIKQLRAELIAQKNIVEGDVVQAYHAVAMQRQKIRAYQQKALEQSQQIARMAHRSYEVGQSDITSVLVAQQASVQVCSDYLDAVYAYELAYTDLEQSIGTPFY